MSWVSIARICMRVCVCDKSWHVCVYASICTHVQSLESPCLVVLNAASCSIKLACEPAIASAFWKVPETFRLSSGDLLIVLLQGNVNCN